MFDPGTVIVVFCLYMAFLFGVALWVERKSATGKSPANNPVIYSLSLAVYCTAWTYYGSVGKAATSGMLFLTIYLGPTLAIVLWGTILRKLVRLKTTYRITSIADFISARYNKSQPLAALVTFIALVGLIPYIALQLKAIFSTFSIITTPLTGDIWNGEPPTSWLSRNAAPVVVVLLALFTIIMGVRRLDPTERHEGMVMALAVECLVKLVAFMAAGVFVTFVVYDGFGDIFNKLWESPFRHWTGFGGKTASPYLVQSWTSYMILSMSAILFLPRQFHVAVVENSNEKHISTALWAFPLYMFLINLFVLPIAAAGMLHGYPIHAADNFVLHFPLHYAKPWLALLVFIGGVSAAAGMIMISSMTMAIMLTNHLLLPFFGWFRLLAPLKHHLLKCRWATVTGFILVGYGFENRIGESYMLVNIGIISFAAVLQFAPAILGGIFWRKGSKVGAAAGLSAGFVVWAHTLFLPSLAKSGWLSDDFIDRGPWGLGFLKPEALFGLEGMDPVSHTVFWSLVFNVGGYVLGSLLFEMGKEERSLAEEFVEARKPGYPFRFGVKREAFIDAAGKHEEILALLRQYFSSSDAQSLLNKCLDVVDIRGVKRLSIVQLVELHSEVEKSLGGSIGSAAAHKAVRQGTFFTPREARELTEVYGEILADLKVTPTELKTKIDYYQERETLLTQQAMELEGKVRELQREIAQRKRAQKALRESEEQYRRLVESMNEGLEIEDERGIVTYVNDRLCRMLGYAPDEIVGRPPTVFLDADQRSVFHKQEARRDKRETDSYEITWTGKDGRKVPTIVSTAPIFDSERNRQGSFAVITDITQRKIAEQALRESEERYRSLVENIDLGITLIDRDYNILMTNSAQGRLFGHPSERFIGKKCYTQFGRDHKVCPYCPGARVMAHGRPEEVDVEAKRSDGSRFPVRIQVFPVRKPDGTISGFIEVMQDVTERKQAEEERRRLATAVEQAAESILITDRRGVIQYVNPAFERTSGYNRDEVIGRTPRILRSPRHDDSFFEEMWKTLAGGQVWTGHFINQRKDGGSYEAETTISPIRDSTGEIISYVSVGRDVTQLVRLEKQLRQAQKMEAIGTLAGGIAHDFNNILTIILGFTEMVLEDVPEDAPWREDLEEVLTASYRARSLVEQILTFSRQSEEERKSLYIGPIVKETIKLLRASIPATIEIRQEVESESGMIMGDPTQIHQVLMNLCTNAVHAMREKGGILEIRLKDVEMDAETVSQYPDLRPGAYLQMTVSDTGHGMDRAVQERIFDPFFTTKGPHEGTGLGLAVIYGIVKNHGGSIRVYSEPGQGATFNILLPKVQQESPSDAGPLEPLPGGDERILFVDDEEPLRQMGRKMMERLGYEVVAAADGREALDIFREDPERFQLVITDQTMPAITGDELAKALLEIRPDIPIILCTGFSETVSRERAQAMGIEEFVMKPIVKGEIARTIRRVLDGEAGIEEQGTRPMIEDSVLPTE